MARLVTSGFDIYAASFSAAVSDPDGTTLNGSTESRATTGQRTGASCLRVNSTGNTGGCNLTVPGVNERGYWVRCYIKFGSATTSFVRLFYIGTTNTDLGARIDSTGRVFHANAATTFSTSINDGAWHRVETFTFFSATQANRIWELRVDGTTISSGTAQTGDSVAPTILFMGWGAASTADVSFDDLAVNDDQGSAQNSWPGDGAVVCVLPAADGAVGAGWTLGTGTAISGNSGATAVKNTPPLGVADLAAGSDPKQIRNATANANVNYDATMQTYTAAGVPSGATINVVDPVVLTAAPVATSAKLGTVGVVSNPAITNINLAAAGTSGAFWQGNAAGTWPTGWKWSHGTVTLAPSVTLGTAPVMRITQVTSSTRIAIVGFMGMYVDYTPAAAAAAAIPDVGMALTVT